MKNIRYAVVGLGHIAQVAVLPAFRRAKRSELVALVSGDKVKRDELSRRYDAIPFAYEDYDRLLASGEIDAVFLALPNTMHEEYATRALEAGVHVLCEKPLTVSREASRRLAAKARRSHLKVMTAYRPHFDPGTLRAIELANSGAIGTPHYFTSEFGYQLRENNIRNRPEEGGSPLHDIGVYCINAARLLFKAEPIEVFAFAANPIARPSRITQTVAATLKFSHERLAGFICSFGSATIDNYRIVGTTGNLFAENAYEYVGSAKYRLTRGEHTKSWSVKAGDQFAAELDYFSGCVLGDRQPEPSFEAGQTDVEIIGALLESLRKGKPVSLRGRLPKIKRRPSRALEIRRRAHGEPALVRVAAPH